MPAPVRAFLFVTLLVGAFVVGRVTPLGDHVVGFAREVISTRQGTGAMLAFGGIYALAIALGLPGTLLTLVGGAAFGLWRGLAINLAGALFGATLAFLEGRYLGRDLARRWFGRRLARLDGLERPGDAFLAFVRLRLIPLLPFGAANFAAGVTRAPLGPYVAGTALGILPSTILCTHFADALVNGDGATRAEASARFAVAMGGLFVISLGPYVVRWWRRRRARGLLAGDAGTSRMPLVPCPPPRRRRAVTLPFFPGVRR